MIRSVAPGDLEPAMVKYLRLIWLLDEAPALRKQLAGESDVEENDQFEPTVLLEFLQQERVCVDGKTYTLGALCSAGGVGLEELWMSAHLNCAAVAIKLGDWSGACAACSVVLQQSPSHPKVRSVYTLTIWLHKSIQDMFTS